MEKIKSIVKKKWSKSIVKGKFPFFGKRNSTTEYDEAKKTYFNILLTKSINEIIFLILHIIILAFYRAIFVSQNLGNIEYEYFL